MIISSWNIRGLNMPLKQSGVVKHLKRNKVAIMGLMETKLNHQSLDWMARSKLVGWRVVDNFSHHPNGRILVIWKEDLAQLDVIQATNQVIHYLVTCKITAISFYISYVYAFNTVVERHPLWHNLCRFRFSQNPWILLGDFNNVLSSEERINGQPVSLYEIWEFKECCYDLSLTDIRSTGVFYTWTNSRIWCKLDKAMVNMYWSQRGLSDKVTELQSRALKLAEAEASFCSQLAKAKYLKHCDRGTKFFHGIIKSRQAKTNISSITLESGARSTSNSQVSEAFVQFYKGLLGTKGACTELNRDMVSRGRLLDSSQAQTLTQPVSEEKIKKALFSIGDDKAPGPDGYSSYFFKKAWDIVGMDFVEAVMEFFSSGQKEKVKKFGDGGWSGRRRWTWMWVRASNLGRMIDQNDRRLQLEAEAVVIDCGGGNGSRLPVGGGGGGESPLHLSSSPTFLFCIL
ncbi:hypothetical protein Acr_16g0010490 [Actinidia rufa]|uniref:Endonuclease/exonuclease/phosphatase domain-containing protein n=1 Tax=Actinidia rufa TaxID=165716 RepID=A0A7J0G0G6_9ERIC|nr:hypothetical protein Acr_16g0010490 [Actinidia rufa]